MSALFSICSANNKLHRNNGSVGLNHLDAPHCLLKLIFGALGFILKGAGKVIYFFIEGLDDTGRTGSLQVRPASFFANWIPLFLIDDHDLFDLVALLDAIKELQTFKHLAKTGVGTVEVRSGLTREDDEKLGTTSILARMCH
jgi:hypothetical protein